MEFFIWCWIWDRRLLCGLSHGRALFIYLWLIPMIVSIGVLPYALYQRFEETSDTTDEKCNKITEVRELGELLKTFIYIEEGILCLSILTCFGMVMKTRSIFNRLIVKQKGAICSQAL